MNTRTIKTITTLERTALIVMTAFITYLLTQLGPVPETNQATKETNAPCTMETPLPAPYALTPMPECIQDRRKRP